MKSTEALGLQALFRVSLALGQVLNLEQALQSVLQVFTGFLSSRKAAIMLLDPETGHISRQVLRGFGVSEILLRGQELSLLAQRRHQPFVWTGGSQDIQFLDPSNPDVRDRGQIDVLGVPVALGGVVLGLLLADQVFPPGAPLETELEFLTLAAGVLASMIGLNREAKAKLEELRRENISLRAALEEKTQDLVMVSRSPAMAEVKQAQIKAAAGKGPVLITGETGVGKNLAARIIHEMSPRAGYPFVKVNCASQPEHLLEAEIFGCERGVVNGVARARPGRLEEADGGALFLEEVAELTPQLQARLLKFLQEREFQRLGSPKTRRVEVRLMAATSRDLEVEVKAGGFLEELYACLRGFVVHLPPLRERREDIPPLLNHFLDRISKEYGRRFYFTRAAQALLQEYDWPGNAREMENLVERLALMVEGGEMDVKDLPSYLIAGAPETEGPDHLFRSRLKEMERREIVAALERNRWVQSQAAVELGLTLRQIGYRVKQFGLERVIREQRSQLHPKRI
jgi:Nif-specific regulatory protein